MNHSIKFVLAGMAALTIMSCRTSGGDDPGVEYAPDMYVAKGYEPFSQLQDQNRVVVDPTSGSQWAINPDGKNMREPVKGSIARGQLDYQFPYAKTTEDYERAGTELKNPLEASAENLEAGKHLYEVNCTPCHGESGKADGSIVQDGKYPPPPSYDSDRIRSTSDGKMYFSITYGKNLMGSYASALSPKERWQVIHYIRTLTGAAAPAAAPAKTDSTASAK